MKVTNETKDWYGLIIKKQMIYWLIIEKQIGKNIDYVFKNGFLQIF